MIRCLVVGASPGFRVQLREILRAAGDVEVVGEAAVGPEAVRQAERLNPDVVALELAAPEDQGLAVIRGLLEAVPTQVVVLTPEARNRRAGSVLRALQQGALEVVPRPDPGPSAAIHAHALRTAVRLAAGVPPSKRRSAAPAKPHPSPRKSAIGCVGIASSTGGPGALQRLLAALPGDFPVPIAVVQHIAQGFGEKMVGWLSETSALRIKLAEQGEVLRPGTVYFAPGAHLLVEDGVALLDHGPPVGGHKPSGTVLFDSLAKSYGRRAIGLVLTGMGQDGCAGLGRLRGAGGHTLAQSERGCVVYGMPRVALESGAAERAVDLDELPDALLRLVR